MQFFRTRPKPPVWDHFSTPTWAIVSTTLWALALLYGFDGKNEARVVSVSVSKPNLKAAAFCETVGRFYAGTVSSGFGGLGRTLPIGLSSDGKIA